MTSPSAYLPHIAARLIGRLWWLSIPACGLILYGLAADPRWCVVGLILLLIAYPMVMGLAIIKYAASPKILRRAAAARAEVTATEIRLYDADGTCVETIAYTYAPTRRGTRLLYLTGPAPDDLLLLPCDTSYFN